MVKECRLTFFVVLQAQVSLGSPAVINCQMQQQITAGVSQIKLRLAQELPTTRYCGCMLSSLTVHGHGMCKFEYNAQAMIFFLLVNVIIKSCEIYEQLDYY